MSETVKSAERVLQVFEYFARVRAPASVMEIAKALGYPQSSTSMLLKSLHGNGYLDHDARARTYVPNVRLALLAGWISDATFRDETLGRKMERLRALTNETVLLALQIGVEIQYVEVLPSSREISFHLRTGTRRPITRAAVGWTLLSLRDDAEVRLMVRHCNAECEPHLRVAEGEMVEAIAAVRAQGFAMTAGHMVPGAGVIAMALPLNTGSSPLAVGVGGPLERIGPKRDELVATMRAVLGPVPQARAG
ncbi:IclR family transcriptional regulator [Zavarzinia sp. CC-PAN008]|uniref:IclR family transcriptional regulator n=1 Tax=Zavarzinia sp. CC-PAN008 TaxID=3243332 RepID=UPI003F746713